MISRHLMTAHETRMAHLQRVQQRRLQRAARPMRAPYVPSLRNDDSLPAVHRAADLPVRVPPLPGLLRAGDGLQLFWNDAPAGEIRWLDGTETYPLDMYLPKALLSGEGCHALSYRLIGASGNWPCSESLRVVIDSAPATSAAPEPAMGVDPEIDEIGLTLDYLEKHHDRLQLTLPMPARLAPFVAIELYWRTATFGLVTAARLDITPAHRAGAPVEVSIDGAFIGRHADSSAELSYALLDAIGQRTLASPIRSIALYLTPLPERLPLPGVPLADDPIAIDWTYVALEGNAPALAVRYSLGSPFDDNQAFARETPVNVHFALPGGPSGLAEVAFLDSNAHGWLIPGPDALPHTRLKVPAYRNMAVGDVIQLFWQGLDDTSGSGNALPGTGFGPMEVPVEATHLENGIEVRIDWERCVQDIVHGSARVRYSVRRGDVLFRGPDALVRVDMRGTSQATSHGLPPKHVPLAAASALVFPGRLAVCST